MAATPTVRQRRLGAELRRLRERLGPTATADEIATRLGWSPSKLSRIENARIGVRVSDVRLLLELYEVDEGHMGEILALAQAATQRGWWDGYRHTLPARFAAYVALEDEASEAFLYSTYSVPALLQTREYALSVIETGRTVTLSTPREMKRTLDVRMRRQELLRRRQPLDYSAVIDESVLLRLVGDSGIMRRQLKSLVALAELPNVNLFVQRLSIHREPLMGESFTLLKFDPAYDVQFPDVAYVDSFQLQVDVQDDTITDRYGRAWEALRRASLSSEESKIYISRIAHEIWRDQAS
ncbi:helix-turn-helix transcriptional regulator [Actinomadura sp. 7K507]|uniref:helix-turn-helix domain-containing protein n=1 Tax=Actinomadura sp. 7K507 TaxID=2530365 RepID=UPI001FB78609|nr:helix-turn-helix transcriptional regulator [Actinomadura sp. 7K507]